MIFCYLMTDQFGLKRVTILDIILVTFSVARIVLKMSVPKRKAHKETIMIPTKNSNLPISEGVNRWRNFIWRIEVVGRQGFDEVGDRYKNMGPMFTATS